MNGHHMTHPTGEKDGINGARVTHTQYGSPEVGGHLHQKGRTTMSRINIKLHLDAGNFEGVYVNSKDFRKLDIEAIETWGGEEDFNVPTNYVRYLITAEEIERYDEENDDE